MTGASMNLHLPAWIPPLRLARHSHLQRRSGVAVFAILWLALALGGCRKSAQSSDEFTRLSNLGKSQLEQGDVAKAIDYFEQALKLSPTLPEAQLNLANAFLRANRAADAIRQAGQVLRVDPNSAAALYVQGCAHLRLGDATNAVKSFQQSQKIDPVVTALNFQLAQIGRAHV